MSIDSKYCKAALFSYFRFGKGISFIASECGLFSADMLLVTKKHKLVEIEIKISRADFRNDFKKYKHENYHMTLDECIEKAGANTPYRKRQAKEYFGYHPTQFYFAVPEELQDYVTRYLEERNSKYGVMVVLDSGLPHNRKLKWMQRVKVVKRAKRLHNDEVNEKVKNKIVARMSSELSNLWQKAIK